MDLIDFLEEFAEITGEFIEDIADTCMNEGVEVLKATPAAVKEMSDIVIPLVNPTPLNVVRSIHTVDKVIKDFRDG